jgi:hypothetical protein
LKAEAVRAREEEERGNAMKALENRTKDSKREMDIMEALDEMKSLKARCGQGKRGVGEKRSAQGRQGGGRGTVCCGGCRGQGVHCGQQQVASGLRAAVKALQLVPAHAVGASSTASALRMCAGADRFLLTALT